MEAKPALHPYHKPQGEELMALSEEKVAELDAENARRHSENVRVFTAALKVAEEIDPTNREIRSLALPEPPSLTQAWREAKAKAEAAGG